MAVEEFFGAETAWFSEVAPAAVKVYEHHNPDVPNLGDITKIDWTATQAVDIMCGGSPCQDLSHAGKGSGMKDGTRSGLWSSMCEAIDISRNDQLKALGNGVVPQQAAAATWAFLQDQDLRP